VELGKEVEDISAQLSSEMIPDRCPSPRRQSRTINSSLESALNGRRTYWPQTSSDWRI